MMEVHVYEDVNGELHFFKEHPEDIESDPSMTYMGVASFSLTTTQELWPQRSEAEQGS
jgi:hypothetical protein